MLRIGNGGNGIRTQTGVILLRNNFSQTSLNDSKQTLIIWDDWPRLKNPIQSNISYHVLRNWSSAPKACLILFQGMIYQWSQRRYACTSLNGSSYYLVGSLSKSLGRPKDCECSN